MHPVKIEADPAIKKQWLLERMEHMKIIQCFNSKPMTKGRHVCGTYGADQIDLPHYIRLVMQLSAIQCRRTNGPVTLYTDSPMKKYLEEKHMMEWWDQVDTEILDSMTEVHPDIDSNVFWSAAKFACYEKQEAPFICIDTDLILWKKLEILPDTALGFAHWESIEEKDLSYPPLEMLQIPSGYKFHNEASYAAAAANMSVTFIGNDKLRKQFVKEAFSFMEKNQGINPQKRYATPEILYMEQRLPLAIAADLGLAYEPFMNTVWSPKQFRFIKPDPRYGDWFFAGLDSTKPFTHLWFHKQFLQSNEEARMKYIKELENKIIETGNKPITA